MSDAELLAWILAQGVPAGNCLDWPNLRFKNGYGHTWYKGEHWYVHRLVYYLANGPIPEGLDVRHSCDRRPCFFLGHLLPGTRLDNMRDADERDRIAYGAHLPQTKLSPDAVRELRRLRNEQHWTYKQLAKEFGVNQMAAWACATRKNHKRVQ